MLSSHLPILPNDLKPFEQNVATYFAQVKWKPTKSLVLDLSTQDERPGAKLWRPAPIGLQSTEETLSLLKIARTIGGDATLLPASLNRELWAIRTGICLGLHLARQYGIAAGLNELQVQNSSGRLPNSQQEEFRSKVTTSCAVALFVAASYVVWELGSFEPDKISGTHVEFHGIPEVALQSPPRAIECMLFYLAAYLDPQKSGLVKTDYDAIAMTIQYFEGIIAEIKTREGSFKYTEFFTNVSYQLADTDFTVQGFDALRATGAVSVEFNRVRFDEIVGNRAAKHAARRLAERLVCYDPVEKKNPIVELGAMQFVQMGFGSPGTGKSMQIAATATLLSELCGKIGIPFLFWPLPDNIISTFQGGSAERMIPWITRFADDDKIVYGAIDDGENVLEDRTRNGVSAGVREVVGVFLRHTEGAYAIHRGNSVIQVFTNLPEQIDKAVLSRIQARFPINGDETEHDFLDQDHIWWRKLEKVNPGFVDMTSPRGYTYLADQGQPKNLGELGGNPKGFADPRIQEIYGKLLAKGLSHKDQDFFASLFAAVHRVYPLFTSRDVRNIQSAVGTRVMDFDLPPEWFETPDLFFRQDYATKLAMLKDLMRANMKGLSFADIRLQETVVYLDGMATIANIDRERRIAAIIDADGINREVIRRINE